MLITQPARQSRAYAQRLWSVVLMPKVLSVVMLNLQ
jgi:hypothetical protein